MVGSGVKLRCKVTVSIHDVPRGAAAMNQVGSELRT